MTTRTLKFGKYKGKAIKKIILTHIGYIMWCLSNLNWFHLDEEEQDLYDYIAIAFVKYNVEVSFPINEMCSHIKNVDAYKNLETPFKVIDKNIYPSDIHHKVVKDALRFKDNRPSFETRLRNFANCYIEGIGEDSNIWADFCAINDDM